MSDHENDEWYLNEYERKTPNAKDIWWGLHATSP